MITTRNPFDENSGTGLPGHCTLSFVLFIVVSTVSCNRAFYREHADADAYALVESKRAAPHWPLDGYTIDVDPRLRMYDPCNPDCPPMPPDDPTAHQLMHCIDCKRGYPHWHAHGDTPHVENPDWWSSLLRDETGAVVINAQTAMQLALLHSPDYQEELEDLYLSALDVSFERFRFDTQFFGGSELLYTADGRDRAAIGGDSTSELQLSTFPAGRDLQMQRLFATGGELVVGLANSLMWQFSGPNTDTVNTLLDFSLIQPLLRGGGRDRVLERLTVAERALLANVRQMERFRRGFYVEVISGRDAGPGPSRRGGVFGGAGLEGFTGIGGGGFGGVGSAIGGGIFGAGAAQAGGFLGLLQDQQDIVNQSANIAALQSSVVQLEAFFLSDRIDYFQVELARQALYNSQSRLLNSELAFQRSLDAFKLRMGLPPHIELHVEDELIQPFQVVDTAIVPLQNQLTAIQQSVGRSIMEVLSQAEALQATNDGDGKTDNQQAATTPDTGPADADEGEVEWEAGLGLAWNTELADRLRAIQRDVAKTREICEKVIEQNLPRARRDLVRLRQAMPQRKRDMAILRRRFQRRLDVTTSTSSLADRNGQSHADPLPLDPERLDKLPVTLNATLADLDTQYSESLKQLDGFSDGLEAALRDGPQLKPGELYRQLEKHVFEPVPSELTELAANVLSLTLVQARARTESVSLVPVDIEWSSALDIARANRRDWMNARASLVDSWRLIQFNANDLESDLDVVFRGDIGNIGDNPLDLRDSTGRLQVGLQFDAPITRIAERNTYRQALIEYQQARRSYYQFEDRIASVLRDSVRTMDVNRLNFELRRAAIEVAIAQVELARLRLQEPPKPDEDAQFGATTARDLVTALTDLLSVQNDFLSVWINHEALRRALDFDMGTMQLDPFGMWVDPGPLVANDADTAVKAASENTADQSAPDSDNRQDRLESIGPGQPVDDRGVLPEQNDTSAGSAGTIQRVAYLERVSGDKRASISIDDPPKRLPPVDAYPLEPADFQPPANAKALSGVVGALRRLKKSVP